MWEIEKTFLWEDAKAMSAKGWELVSVIQGGGFYFKRKVSKESKAVEEDTTPFPPPKKKRGKG